MALTKRQKQVLDFIANFVDENGYCPSFEEIARGLELASLATVHKHITNLEKKGLLTRDYNRSRSIDLLPPKGRLKQAMSVNTTMVLPLLGRIAAGQPIGEIRVVPGLLSPRHGAVHVAPGPFPHSCR
jgi:repressor LexA